MEELPNFYDLRAETALATMMIRPMMFIFPTTEPKTEHTVLLQKQYK